jgi:serine/threonine-protein kinase
MAERQFGPYRLVRQIAVGGMAEIHLAKTKGIAGFEKYVALKMIHPNLAEDDQFIQMLVDEAKIAVQLNHGNIAQTFDLGRVGDTYYITMEFVDGADLYKILRRASEQDQELPLDVCAFVAKEMASALDHAHRKKDHSGRSLRIVHRDVSPQNVLISYSGEVKLVDFGIAQATMKARQTAVGVIKGKYYYMSPEQARGDRIDHRSDIFSAGIVLYEMITGQMLYLEEDLQRLLDMVRKADIRPPSTLRRGVPPQLERIVMHALARSASDRYPSAAEFAIDLERFLHTYSPVFTAAKVAHLIKKVLGDPDAAPEVVEMRDGKIGSLNPDELVHEKDELHDENSVLFRMSDLDPQPPEEPRPAARAPTRQPRDPHMHTREVSADSSPWDGETTPGDGDHDSAGERTVISSPPSVGGFLADVTTDDATLISSAPERANEHASRGAADFEAATIAGDHAAFDDDVAFSSDEGPTVQRDPGHVRTPPRRGAPPALAANIHAPAVSELRRRRASRKTPTGGAPVAPANILQAIVGAHAAESIPEPAQVRRRPNEDSAVETMPVQMVPASPPVQPYALPHAPAPLPYVQPPYGYPSSQPHPSVSPGALYPGAMNPPRAPSPMSLTGQLRLLEADEIPPQYKVPRGGRWLVLAITGAIIIPTVAAVTVFITKATRDRSPAVASIHIESNPQGAEVSYDGTKLAGVTPITIDSVPTGFRHEIKVQYPHHRPYVETVDIPKTGGQLQVTAILKPITGKLAVDTVPGGADVYINGQPRGHTPTTITDLDMDSAKKIELKLRGYQDFAQDLVWPANGELAIEAKLQR